MKSSHFGILELSKNWELLLHTVNLVEDKAESRLFHILHTFSYFSFFSWVNRNMLLDISDQFPEEIVQICCFLCFPFRFVFNQYICILSLCTFFLPFEKGLHFFRDLLYTAYCNQTFGFMKNKRKYLIVGNFLKDFKKNLCLLEERIIKIGLPFDFCPQILLR